MADISKTLRDSTEDVRKAITDMSNASSDANADAMKKMQEQIDHATASINNGVDSVKGGNGSNHCGFQEFCTGHSD